MVVLNARFTSNVPIGKSSARRPPYRCTTIILYCVYARTFISYCYYAIVYGIRAVYAEREIYIYIISYNTRDRCEGFAWPLKRGADKDEKNNCTENVSHSDRANKIYYKI